MAKKTPASRNVISGAPVPNTSRDAYRAAADRFGATATEIEKVVRGKLTLGRGLTSQVQEFVAKFGGTAPA